MKKFLLLSLVVFAQYAVAEQQECPKKKLAAQIAQVVTEATEETTQDNTLVEDGHNVVEDGVENVLPKE